jgi:hypothetical protein
MGQLIEINEGEVVVKFTEPVSGKVSFEDLGLTSENLSFDGGFLRLVFDMEGIGEHHYFQVPTIEVAYKENMGETHWQCDFNGETILDKMDNHGNNTVILLNRKKLSELEHHHENALILHAEFPEGVNILADKSYINFFK